MNYDIISFSDAHIEMTDLKFTSRTQKKKVYGAISKGKKEVRGQKMEKLIQNDKNYTKSCYICV